MALITTVNITNSCANRTSRDAQTLPLPPFAVVGVATLLEVTVDPEVDAVTEEFTVAEDGAVLKEVGLGVESVVGVESEVVEVVGVEL